ncbi:MAG: LysE family translocator [Bdellovibrionota bacterium]
MMYWSNYFMVLGVFSMGLISPGPDFAVVLQSSILGGRSSGYRTAVGIAVGLTFHIGFCVMGLGYVLKNWPNVFVLLQCCGGIYLMHLGASSFLQMKRFAPSVKIEEADSLEFQRPFAKGVITNLLNPKATLSFWIIFSSLIPWEMAQGYRWIYGGSMIVMALGWFLFVAHLITWKRILTQVKKASTFMSIAMTGLFFCLGGFAVAQSLLHWIG